MKTFRVFGAIFVVFGFFFALLGILTSVFPMIKNEHFQMILNSFQETSADALTNTLNSIVRFCLHSSYFLLLCGISLMVAGGLISASAHKKQKAAYSGSEPRRTSSPASNTPGFPKPAYYPGGLAPPAADFPSGQESGMPPEEEGFSGFGFQAARKAGPISGGVEPSFTTDDNDAQRLMQHDLLLTSQPQPGTPDAPEYAQYLSNAEPDEADTVQTRAEYLAGSEEEASEPPQRPKIVSTMGKRKA